MRVGMWAMALIVLAGACNPLCENEGDTELYVAEKEYYSGTVSAPLLDLTAQLDRGEGSLPLKSCMKTERCGAFAFSLAGPGVDELSFYAHELDIVTSASFTLPDSRFTVGVWMEDAERNPVTVESGHIYVEHSLDNFEARFDLQLRLRRGERVTAEGRFAWFEGEGHECRQPLPGPGG